MANDSVSGFGFDEVVAALSHELRTPLTAILGWSRVLRTRGFDEATCRRALEAIERNALAQAHIIEGLLDVSELISGQTRLELRPLDLATVIRDAVTATLDARAVPVEIKLDNGAARFVGDRSRLQRALANVLSVAANTTPAGKLISVALEQVQGRPRITVRTVAASGGSGALGLLVARRIVEQHGGSVRMETAADGSGTAVVVTLPDRAERRAA